MSIFSCVAKRFHRQVRNLDPVLRAGLDAVAGAEYLESRKIMKTRNVTELRKIALDVDIRQALKIGGVDLCENKIAELTKNVLRCTEPPPDVYGSALDSRRQFSTPIRF